MEQLSACVQRLFTCKNEDTSNFYTYLADLNVCEENEKYVTENLIPEVYELCDRKVLRKDLIYLALLGGQNNILLEKFIECDKRMFVFNADSPISLYDYCIYYHTHWICEIIEKPKQYERFTKNGKIYSKLNMVKFTCETNLEEVNIEQLEELLNEINLNDLEEFWGFYVNTTKKFIETVKFCKTILKREVSDSPIFKFATSHSTFDTLSHFCDLSNTNNWGKILNKLEIKEDEDTFTSFIIIGTIFKLLITREIQQCDQLSNNILNWLLNLKNKNHQIELLENTISLMLHQKNDHFTCKEPEIRFILTLVKKTIEELQLRKIIERNTEHHNRLTNLNKQVTDCLWRLDLITNTKKMEKVEHHILSYMLAPPESLIAICLKEHNFERARQVVEIFNLRGSDLGKLVVYSEEYHKFKTLLRKNGKVEDLDRKLLQFLQKHEAVNFTKIFDFALTETKTWEESELVLKLAKQNYESDDGTLSTYQNFYKKVVEVAEAIGPKRNLSLPEILTNYPLDLPKYNKQQEFYDSLYKLYDEFQKVSQKNERGTFNKNHETHKILMNMNQLIETYKGPSENQYLAKLFNYLKAFSKVLYIEQNTSGIISKGKNSSFFDLLNVNRSELTGKLLFEKQLDPTEFEKYFGKLKLDFLYHIVGNCFPTINLHIEENVTIEELYHDNMLYIPSASIIVYIQKRNWLLAFILKEMYRIEDVKIDISETRLQTFFNYLKLPRIQNLKTLFEKNDIVASLQNCISAQSVKLYFREQIVEHDSVSIQSQNSNSSDVLETGEEIQEDTKTTNWKGLLGIVEGIPEAQLRKKTDLIHCRDNVLVNLVQDGFEPNCHRYTFFISDRNLRINTILCNSKKWSGSFACDIIKCEISRFEDTIQDSGNLREWLKLIELNEELKDIFPLKSWFKSHNFCKNHPESALDQLILGNKVDHILDFINLYKPSEEHLMKITSSYIFQIINSDVAFSKIKSLLEILPYQQSIEISFDLLRMLKQLDQLQFIADYLQEKQKDDLNLKLISTSLKMLTVFNTQERAPFFCLINEPMSILEVLIMNTKLDKLSTMLDILDNNVITIEMIDQLLRQYAEKSLDFRVNTNPNRTSPTKTESKLLLSFDSVSMTSNDKKFIIPETIPSKEEWVQNEEVTDCMCCKQITFSMFNRRHHCRRCGRVVCYSCSLKRMLVPSYGDILVRVCIECFNQTEGSESEQSSRSFVQEYWLLNDNLEHNKIIREEFSYEHAPSTSLCLSILKYHSRTPVYAKFLLDQCEVMLKLLQPTREPTHEIDYLLGIKMLKSLAMAAKMASSGSSTADRILSQAELLALLAERGCLHLMPVVGSQIDPNVLRRLRDKLLQLEQWNLALEVSTKGGLDNTGVFAAWGKTCLKAGSLLTAREKFQRCLDKNSQYETSSFSSRQSESFDSQSICSVLSDSKPSKDPPLLHEIIHILEMKREFIHDTLKPVITGSWSSLNQVNRADVAISVLNRLKRAKEIVGGNLGADSVKNRNPYSSKPSIDPVFYNECVYYLRRYGTHLSLLEFYVRHGNLKAALIYTLENHLSPDLFVEIYLKCLKLGIVIVFQEQMSFIDSSLDLWKDYLKYLCRYLEKQQLLNCLYQLQLYIGDYVRASMTCIRFYEENVKSFTELMNNVGYLYKGEEHLRQILEQEQWVEVTSVGETTSSKGSFEERMITNPDLVMKIETKDVNRHIHTVKRQIEVVSFLANRESLGVNTRGLLRELNSLKEQAASPNIPTLFGTTSDKITLCVMLLISGATIEEGFDLVVKLMDDFKLRPMKVYCLTGKFFAKREHYSGITQLVSCIKSRGNDDAALSDMLDEMLSQSVDTLIKENITGTKVEDLIKLIKDRATKISAYIEAKQLKTAYFLAVKYKRTSDIRRIQREAELLNMPTIKALCQKVLQNPQHSKEAT